MVRFDTAKGTYCAMQNVSDDGYGKRLMELGKNAAEATIPGGMCSER